jgi:hypothetical protein
MSQIATSVTMCFNRPCHCTCTTCQLDRIVVLMAPHVLQPPERTRHS